VSEVTSQSHKEFQKADKIVAVAYLSSPTEEPAAEYSATAEKHRDDFLFGLTTDKDAIAEAGVTVPAIVVYRRFDEPRVEYPYPVLSAKVKDIEEWIQDLSIPIIDELGRDNYDAYAHSSKPLAYLFLDPADEKKEEYISAFKPVAQQYKAKMNFVWIDAVTYADHAKALNLQETKWPGFVIHSLGNQLKYPYDQSKPFTPEGAGNWVQQFLDGKLKPELKSQPIPETQNESVFNLVGKQFEEIVFDDSKDVFIELYASWSVSLRSN
jgi:protein disulfide-isomerase A1